MGRQKIIRTPEELEISRLRKNERDRNRRAAARTARTPEEQEVFSQQRNEQRLARITSQTPAQETAIRERRNQRQRESRNAARMTRTPEEQEAFHARRREQDRERQRINRQTAIDIFRNANNNILELEEHYLGPMNVECNHCHAKHFEKEKVSGEGNSFNDCCNHGKVNLKKYKEYPP